MNKEQIWYSVHAVHRYMITISNVQECMLYINHGPHGVLYSIYNLRVEVEYTT